MKSLSILIVGLNNTESFAVHIRETLLKMGHRATIYEPVVRIEPRASTLQKRWGQAKRNLFELAKHIPTLQRWQTRDLLRMATELGVELTIVCHDFLMPAEVRALREVTRAPVVLWFPDSMNTFNRSFFFNAPYDMLFFKDPYVVNILRNKLSKEAYYLPECCNPDYHYPCELSEQDYLKYSCELTVAGNIYPYRVAFFEQLSDFHVKIWGNLPPLWLDTKSIDGMLQGEFVAYEEKAKAFRAAKIVVNNLHPAEIWGINARAFEIAATGGFQMIDQRLALGDLFIDGREVVSYTDKHDLRAKIQYFLAHEEERVEIAQRGMERAHRDHTYSHRLTCLLETVFASGNGYAMPRNFV